MLIFRLFMCLILQWEIWSLVANVQKLKSFVELIHVQEKWIKSALNWGNVTQHLVQSILCNVYIA